MAVAIQAFRPDLCWPTSGGGFLPRSANRWVVLFAALGWILTTQDFLQTRQGEFDGFGHAGSFPTGLTGLKTR